MYVYGACLFYVIEVCGPIRRSGFIFFLVNIIVIRAS